MKRVKYIGCSPEQVNWGFNSDPDGILEVGTIYDVENIRVHSWHTTICLKCIEGVFNSVCFEEIDDD